MNTINKIKNVHKYIEGINVIGHSIMKDGIIFIFQAENKKNIRDAIDYFYDTISDATSKEFYFECKKSNLTKNINETNIYELKCVVI